jgi:hypothetical protein
MPFPAAAAGGLLLRFLPWILGGALALGLLLTINGWRKDAAQLPVVRQQFAVYQTDVETARRTRAEVSNEYQGELERLRADAGKRPAPPVRLCQQPPAQVMPAAGTAGGRDGPGTTGGQLPGGTGPSVAEGPGPDIGAELFALADRADRLSAQLRACQSFVDKVRSKPPSD